MSELNYDKCPRNGVFLLDFLSFQAFAQNQQKVRILPFFVSAQIEMVPQNYQKLDSEEQIRLMEKLIEIMEDDDDVQNIWHNWDQD